MGTEATHATKLGNFTVRMAFRLPPQTSVQTRACGFSDSSYIEGIIDLLACRGCCLLAFDCRDLAIYLDCSLCIGEQANDLGVVLQTLHGVSKKPLQPPWILEFRGG